MFLPNSPPPSITENVNPYRESVTAYIVPPAQNLQLALKTATPEYESTKKAFEDYLAKTHEEQFSLSPAGVVLSDAADKAANKYNDAKRLVDTSGVSVTIQSNRLIMLGVVIVLMGCLTYLVMYTKQGRAMRAVSHDFDSAALMGVNVNSIITFTFVVGSALAGAGAMMIATFQGTPLTTFYGLLPGVKAFVAAVLGGIGNIPGAVLGGLLMGVAETVVVWAGFSEYKDAVAFVILIVVLMFRPGGLLGSSKVVESMKFWIVRILSIAAAVAGCFALQGIASGQNDYTQRLIILAGLYVTLAVSLNLINGITGQFSIGHAAFYQVGAYLAAFLSGKYFASAHMPPLVWLVLTMIAGALGAAVAGFVVGLPSLRLRGDYLAIVTLGFGEIIRIQVQNTPALGGSYGMNVQPKIVSIAFVWLLAVLCIAVCRNLLKTAHGLPFLAVREDEIASSAMGVNVTRVKVAAVILGSAFAGAAGALLASYEGFITPATFSNGRPFHHPHDGRFGRYRFDYRNNIRGSVPQLPS